MALLKDMHHCDKCIQVSLGLMAPTHSDSYTIPFKVNLMCINGMKLMKL